MINQLCTNFGLVWKKIHQQVNFFIIKNLSINDIFIKIIGFYEWHDGSSLIYTSFAFNTQTQGCIYSYNNEWYDADCFLSRRIYVCKKPKCILSFKF